MDTTSRRTGGFTLIEMLISLGLMALVIGSVTMASQRGLALFETSSLNSEVTSRSGRTIDRIMRELVAVASSSLDPDLTTPPGNPIVWSSALEFESAVDYAGGAVILGPARRVELRLADGELDNGLDDNGNGLIDESSAVLRERMGQPDEIDVVLVNGVSELFEGETLNGVDDNGNGLIDESGLCFDVDGGTLNVRLSLERRRSNGQLVVRSQQDSIALRN